MDRIMKAIPQNASTVILLRDMEPHGFEVFLLRQHEKSSFMGGNFVYPGGRVDRGDASLEIGSLSKGMTFDEAQIILGGKLSPEESIAHWIAGIRELFEEAGILGEPSKLNDETTRLILKNGRWHPYCRKG